MGGCVWHRAGCFVAKRYRQNKEHTPVCVWLCSFSDRHVYAIVCRRTMPKIKKYFFFFIRCERVSVTQFPVKSNKDCFLPKSNAPSMYTKSGEPFECLNRYERIYKKKKEIIIPAQIQNKFTNHTHTPKKKSSSLRFFFSRLLCAFVLNPIKYLCIVHKRCKRKLNIFQLVRCRILFSTSTSPSSNAQIIGLVLFPLNMQKM